MMEAREVLDWESFRVKFLEKYLPDSARFAKEAEFLMLEQGEMSVNAYAVKIYFCYCIFRVFSVTATIPFLSVFCFWAFVGLWALTCAYIALFSEQHCSHSFINQSMKFPFSLSKFPFTLSLCSRFWLLAISFIAFFTAIGHVYDMLLGLST